MDQVTNVRIYDFDESLHAAGYPMRTSTQWNESESAALKRGVGLSHAADWVGAHDQFLTGIRVAFDLTFTNKAWVEAERYRFLEFVSSQSTMHRITKFNLDNQYCEYVDPRVVEIMKEKVDAYNAFSEFAPSEIEALEERMEKKKKLYLEVLYTNPAGFELTARLTTNYRCLLNIYIQRHDHRLPEWREFCKELLKLPFFIQLVDAYESGKVQI